jgi:hypothetical protein
MRNRLPPWAALPIALVALSTRASGFEPMSDEGDIGRTSYIALPFQSEVYDLCWNCSANLEPAELFFQANPRSPFNSAAAMSDTRQSVAAKERAGIVPSAGIQRWESTFAASFPQNTFSGEPEWVGADRDQGLPQQPEFIAWRDWIAAHPQYLDVAADGGSMPAGFRSWGGSWGYISPLTPLETDDCPPASKAGCNWGDSFAYRWSLTSAKSGAYGLILSDFTDSQPGPASNVHDFNPRIVAAFVNSSAPFDAGVSASSSVPVQANWIVSSHYGQWNDFIAAGYARFYAALVERVGAAAGKKPLLVDQCGRTPAVRRLFGTDARIIAQQLPPQNYVCMWDDHVIQSDRAGPIDSPPIQELAGFAVAAAREPLIRNGANLEADDQAYWTAIAKFYPTLDAASQREVGYRLLKRLWVWSSWAHIADRSGTVRRALAFVSRDYWDSGSLTALNPLASLLRATVPARPFGPALYYSVSAERTVEQIQAKKVGTNDEDIPAYLPAAALQTLLDSGAAVGYYVSDAALAKIGRDDSANTPSAWIVPNADNLVPSAEMAALRAIAPVVTSADALAVLPNQPLKLSKGLAGFGFYDSAGNLILVISNPATGADAKQVSGTVQLAGVQFNDGPRALKNMLTGATQTITVMRHTAMFPLDVQRWDTTLFSLAQS